VIREILLRQQLFILLLAALLLPACSGSSTQIPESEAPAQANVTPRPDRPTPSAAELEVTAPEKTIEVAAGDDFTITLRTNPASGYHWELAEELDSKIVEYVWKDFVPTQPDLPSSSGKDVWRFKGVAPGETRIMLGYYMGMTEDSAEVLTFTVVVK
jgi:predicted secreted protein